MVAHRRRVRRKRLRLSGIPPLDRRHPLRRLVRIQSLQVAHGAFRLYRYVVGNFFSTPG